MRASRHPASCPLAILASRRALDALETTARHPPGETQAVGRTPAHRGWPDAGGIGPWNVLASPPVARIRFIARTERANPVCSGLHQRHAWMSPPTCPELCHHEARGQDLPISGAVGPSMRARRARSRRLRLNQETEDGQIRTPGATKRPFVRKSLKPKPPARSLHAARPTRRPTAPDHRCGRWA